MGAADQDLPRVSVVVPTRSRPSSVVRAVRSALSQSVAPIEVVVVVDGPDAATVDALNQLGDERVLVRELSDNGGPSRARNIGVVHSRGEWIAFLDDDDEWLPDKLRIQLAAASTVSSEQNLVVATGVERKGDAGSDWWPLRSPAPDESVGDYLFVRRRPGEGYLQTSTIMLRRQFALMCPMPEHLWVHEDYDWFLELEKADGRFIVVLDPLVVFSAPTARVSLSTGTRWDTSLAWVLSRRADISPRAFTDFCLTEVARATRLSGGVRAKIAVLFVALTGRPTWFSVARFVGICLVPTNARRRVAGRIWGRDNVRPHSGRVLSE